MDFKYFLTLYIFSEIFELGTQRGSKLSSYLSSLMFIYNRGIFKFLLYNPTFYVVLGATLFFNTMNIFILTLLLLKFFDLLLKILLLDKITNGKPLGFFTNILKDDISLPLGLKIAISSTCIIIFYLAFIDLA